MNRPRILIPIPTSFDEAYNAASWPEYAAAVRSAGGEPVQVTLSHSPADLERMVKAAEGVLLPGSGADVDPSLYGHEKDPASAEPDRLREQTDRAILEAAERYGKPLLGICLGTQSMNVYYGGTLVQDVVPLPVNHRAGRSVQVAHTIVLDGASRVGSVLAAAEETNLQVDGQLRVPVNSSHHQAVGSVGSGLRVVARCSDDDVVEAIESVDADRWLVGVQWHPERTVHTSEASRLLFADFVKATSR
ncbi:MAG: gamma-glutamyl-gamma-aminobutyrate hydrolase family protein [Janthinobacterium lividum]